MARKFVIVGALLILGGAVVIGRAALFMLTSQAVVGTVTAFVPIPGGSHAFRVQYEVEGRVYTVLTSSYDGESAAGPGEFRVGQPLSVRYRTAAPDQGRVYAWQEQLGPALILLVPGVGLLLYGLFPQGATAGPLAKRPS